MPALDPRKADNRQDAEAYLAEKNGDNKKAFIQCANNAVVDNMDADIPLMMQLCKIKEATTKAEKVFEEQVVMPKPQTQLCKIKEVTCGAEKIFEERAAMPKTQSKDPRIPKEVLIEQGISPNPGPLRAKKGKNHFGKLVVLITSVMAVADCSTDARTCVGWAPVGTIERSRRNIFDGNFTYYGEEAVEMERKQYERQDVTCQNSQSKEQQENADSRRLQGSSNVCTYICFFAVACVTRAFSVLLS